MNPGYFKSTAIMLILVTAALFYFTSCRTARDDGPKDYYSQVLEKAYNNIQNYKTTQAKQILLDAAAKETPRHSPYVEDSTLVFYASSSTQSLYYMMKASAFSIVKDKDSVRNDPGQYKELFDLYDKTPWNRSVARSSSYPQIYLVLGITFIDEKKYDKAIAYLDTAVYIWEGLGEAWAEMIYAYAAKGDFRTAKAMGQKALNVETMYLDEYGKSAILRKLGYIAIEEKDLDKAEDYYKQSIKIYDHKVAREELQYIEELRKKK